MKPQYIPPEITVVSFKMERGFASSGTPSGFQETSFLDMFLLQADDDYNSQAQENWHDYDNGTGGNNLFGSW